MARRKVKISGPDGSAQEYDWDYGETPPPKGWDMQPESTASYKDYLTPTTGRLTGAWGSPWGKTPTTATVQQRERAPSIVAERDKAAATAPTGAWQPLVGISPVGPQPRLIPEEGKPVGEWATGTPTTTPNPPAAASAAAAPSWMTSMPGFDANWWNEFTKATHRKGTQDVTGVTPIEYYLSGAGGDEQVAGQMALADKSWGDQFYRTYGRAPTDDDWRWHWYNMRGLNPSGGAAAGGVSTPTALQSWAMQPSGWSQPYASPGPIYR